MKYNSEKAFPYLISILFLFPLFKESILTLLLLLLIGNTIIYVIQHKKFQTPKKEILLLTIPFWIIFLSAIIRFENLNSFKPSNNALLFLLLPIVFNYIPLNNFTTEKINKYLTILKNSCLFIILTYLILFFFNYTIYDFFIVSNNISKFRDFIYNEIRIFKIHPNYFTTILILCTAFSLDKMKNKKNWIELIYISFFVLITFLLITKINIIFIIGLITYYILFKIKGFKVHKVLFLVMFLGALSFIVKNTPGVNERFYELKDSLTKPPKGLAYNSTNIRVALYNCDYELLAENFWVGTGFENIRDEIEKCLSSKYDTSFYIDQQYLTHNYFLYIFISGGIFSFIFYLFYLYTALKTVRKANSFILYVFFISILSITMIEDFFYRMYGLFFFNLILLIYYKNNLITVKNYIEDES
jgi:O-antigen ligase